MSLIWAMVAEAGTKPAVTASTCHITVEAGGLEKVITGVNSAPHWYRPDPLKPTQTITAVIGGEPELQSEAG